MASNWADVEAPTSSLFHWRSVDPDFMPSMLVSGRSQQRWGWLDLFLGWLNYGKKGGVLSNRSSGIQQSLRFQLAEMVETTKSLALTK